MILSPALWLPHWSQNFLEKCKLAVEVFHFRGLYISMGVDYVKELRSLFAAREGDGCMKDAVHPVRHPRVHLSDRASVRRRRGCARQNGSYGRGMAPSWA